MTMTDPIADMITRIRNGNLVFKQFVDVPFSKMKEAIADVLKEEGFIKNYEIIEENKKKMIRVHLIYYQGKKRAINEIKKISKPGVRVYVKKDEIPRVKDGLGMAVLTTSKGIMSDKKARELGIGGEILFTIW
ncbi:30S ribosomal protein S8 [bacterium]|nr:30S ribosomal protein S8 [bacterium]